VEKEIVSEEKDKPVLDEQMLAKLLEAAYVLQEHNRELKEKELVLELKRNQFEAADRTTPAQGAPPTHEAEPAASGDYTFTLARIVETQHQIQVRNLELESAMALVTERLIAIARASGAAIAILDGGRLVYRAAAGSLALPVGTEVAAEKALCAACLRTGQVFRSTGFNPEFLIDQEDSRRRGIESLIAVPIFHDGGVGGALELYYPTPQAFTEPDVHTCQLMAGLVTEALARHEEVVSKKSLALERAEMLEALEQLKPNLQALVDRPVAQDTAAPAGAPTSTATASASPPTSVFECGKCGHKMVGEEQFCGHCGTPRTGDEYEPPSMQSKVASLWHMQEAMKKTHPAEATGMPADDRSAHPKSAASVDRPHSEKSWTDALEEEMPELLEPAEVSTHRITLPIKLDPAAMSAEFEDSVLADLEAPGAANSELEAKAGQSTALATPEHAAAWSSAASARDFLEQLAAAKRAGSLLQFWKTRRGDIYLAVAVLLVAGVISRAIWSGHSVSATGNPAAGSADHRKPAPEAELSWFDRALISLGLAEAPPPPEYKGNPETQVWVDLQTALYYCPGTDLYGKTAKGKLTSQREAQLDQFEPAYRKACD
jgi:hypothetical protein